MKDISKRKRREYNKKAYQKRKTKKGEAKAPEYRDEAKAPEYRDEAKAPEYHEETKAPEYHEETKAPEKAKAEIDEKAPARGRLTKKSFTLNNKKFALIETEKAPRIEKNKTHSVLMASDRLLILKIYKLYKAVERLHDGDNPPALASPALVLLCDYLEEATTAHENGTPWAMNNYKEIKAFMKDIKEFLLI